MVTFRRKKQLSKCFTLIIFLNSEEILFQFRSKV